MTFTIDLGWYLLPLSITLITFGFSIWRTATAESSGGDYGDIGRMFFFVVAMGVSAIVSLVAWLVWSLAA